MAEAASAIVALAVALALAENAALLTNRVALAVIAATTVVEAVPVVGSAETATAAAGNLVMMTVADVLPLSRPCAPCQV